MDTGKLQDIITLLQGCLGDRIRNIKTEVSSRAHPDGQISYGAGGSYHISYTSSKMATVRMEFTLVMPTRLPQCIDYAMVTMSYMSNTSGDLTADCSLLIGDLDFFLKQLRKELWEEYSDKFDSFIDKLLSEETQN
jgi:hypothetical protein